MPVNPLFDPLQDPLDYFGGPLVLASMSNPGTQVPVIPSAPGVRSITSAMAAEANAHTIQALIETAYVRTGNEILSRGLSQLDDALSSTKEALDVLADLQNLHNAVVVKSLPKFPFDYSSSHGGLDEYQSAYQKLASNYFGLAITPDFIFVSKNANITAFNANPLLGSFSNFAFQLGAAKVKLEKVIADLSNLSPTTDPNSLLAKLKTVLVQLPPGSPITYNSGNNVGKIKSYGPLGTAIRITTSVFQVSSYVISYTNAKLWALDGYTVDSGGDTAQVKPTGVVLRVSGGITIFSYDRFGPNGTLINPYRGSVNGSLVNPIPAGYTGLPIGFGSPSNRNNAANVGKIQQTLTFAITAAQSLNDTQKEAVRRYLYIFEEYYKSASAILTKITEIITKIAQGIRPA